MALFSIKESTVQKWAPVLDKGSALSNYKRRVMAQLLENQLEAFKTDTHLRKFNQMIAEAAQSQGLDAKLLNEAAPANSSGAFPENPNLKGFNPVLISMLRRTMPYLMAFDVAGVQPMSGPSGYIFALKAKYGTQGGAEALHDEADSDYSGTGTHSSPLDPFAGGFSEGTGLTTAAGEALGDGIGADIAAMALSIDRVSVEAKTRALRADYTNELVQDLLSIHGLDAQKELAEILASELMFEINRQVVRLLYRIATLGAQQPGLATPGQFDLNVDSDGRYHLEKYVGLVIQICREANAIATSTRRGPGNLLIVSPNVACALSAAKMLDSSDVIRSDINVDETGRTYVGTLMGRFKVYTDPYYGVDRDFCVVGYRGNSPMEAGFFYCPYIPLQMYEAIDPRSHQPSMSFRTRYGLVESPFGNEDGDSTGAFSAGTNVWYRKFEILNIL